MKKWQKKLMQIVASLGFTSKLETGSLTSDEQKQLFAEYEKVHGISFTQDKALNEDEEVSDETILSEYEQKQLASIFGENPPKTPKQAVNALTSVVANQTETIEKLSASPEPSSPAGKVLVGGPKIGAEVLARVLGRSGHSTTHIFGIEDPLFIRDKWYNKLMGSKTPLHQSEGDISPEDVGELKTAIKSFTSSVKRRIDELSANNQLNQLDYDKLIAGEGIDYSDLFGKAGEYIVRRTDIILAYLRTLPSVDGIFPVVSNVQNKEVVPGAHFGELSQGYRSGKIFKGRANFTAEIYQVNDLMFKFLFEDLIELEKQYIGYLNREGSNVIKWTFIEWIMVYFGQILISEQNQRRVIGVRVPQQNVKENPAMLAADGALRAIERVVEENKVLPFLDLNRYELTNILEYIEEMYDRTSNILPTMNGIQVYANAKHKKEYVRQFRHKYGQDNDFTGVKSGLIDVSPDTIIWIPNMRNNDYIVFLTFSGNIENHEDKPHEMIMYYFEQEWESVGVMSRWKEGSGCRQAGVQYKTLQDLKDSKFKNQFIFVNHPASIIKADATVIDGEENTLFQTSDNTVATNIDDIKNAESDRVYKIVCGGLSNATTLNKSGHFDKITANFVPKAVGDYIKVYAELEDYTETGVDGKTFTATRPTGKFLELKRSVTA